MDKIIANNIKTKVNNAFKALMKARDKAVNELKAIVKEAGGLVLTFPRHDKPVIYATLCYDIEPDNEEIFAIRYDEKNDELLLLTRTAISEYESDTKFYFDYLYDLDGEDLEEMMKVVGNVKYFTPGDKNLLWSTTVLSILGSLVAYID